MPYDKHAHRELDLYTDNERDIYDRKMSLVRNYAKRIKSGKFNKAKAEQGVLNNVVTPAARKYHNEFGGKFDGKTRKGVAKTQLRSIVRGILSGEYD